MVLIVLELMPMQGQIYATEHNVMPLPLINKNNICFYCINEDS